MALTFVRTGEMRFAEWSDIDEEKAEWRIPAERMKMPSPHIVPLSTQALDVIRQLRELNGRWKWIFPSQSNTQKPISENTVLFALYRMGYHSRMTGHGFRGLASTILNENRFEGDWIERQLAHTERNDVRAAYNHAQYLPERRRMMRGGGIILSARAPINARRARIDVNSDYIVFVDESGDHSLTSIDGEYPIFVLCFCVMKKADYADAVVPRLKRLKFETFGHDCVVLHEIDIRRKRGYFSQLSKEPRDAFMDALTQVIVDTPMTVIAVVIEKSKLKERYLRPYNPYHIGIQYGLERVRHFLRLHGQHDATTHVVCEARGAKEDADLELAFRRVCDGDNRLKAKYTFDIVICDKKANSEGLQLADLMARPIGLSVLRPGQPNRAFEVLETKLFTGSHGVVFGNGLKVFP